MINAGTIAAYLTLSTSDFNKGVGDAINQLSGLQMFSKLGASAIGILQGSMFGITGGGLLSFITGMSSARTGTSALLNAVGGLSGGLLKFGPAVSTAAGIIASGILAPLNAVSGSARGAMVSAGDGMISGLNARKPSILATAKSIADSVASTIRSALKIQSPSQVMRELGEYAGQGLELGLADTRAAVGGQAASLAGSLVSSARGGLGPASHNAPFGGDGAYRLADRIDALCSMLERADSVMQVDGRAFGRLVREYS
ncbi:MAG: hypothetical protein FWE86_03920 [Oscillospiraceae bacterium]|nr:hypothetical protein [Oscillospiraceae bacterium]